MARDSRDLMAGASRGAGRLCAGQEEREVGGNAGSWIRRVGARVEMIEVAVLPRPGVRDLRADRAVQVWGHDDRIDSAARVRLPAAGLPRRFPGVCGITPKG